MRKKMLVFSVPFGGHLTILKEFMRQYRHDFEFRLVITGWKNIPPDLDGFSGPTDILNAGTLRETDPALWTFPRTEKLLDRCLAIAKTFHPDGILYDFFSAEGYCTGRLLHIPYWCSIPAMMGPYDGEGYLQKKLRNPEVVSALAALNKRYPLRLSSGDMEMISDGIHLAGQKNIVWSYPAVFPKGWKRNRHKAEYIFAGNIRAKKGTRNKAGRPTVLLSLGTVVLDNLWNRQPETRLLLKKFIADIAKRWSGPDFRVIFVTQGKKILASYPENWTVMEKIDQIAVLGRTDVFVTHAGSNSFHEALVARVPMVALPFFGDQPLVARRIKQLGIGINLVNDTDIDTRKSKKFLSPRLAAALDRSVRNILRNGPAYQSAFAGIPLKATSIKHIRTTL